MSCRAGDEGVTQLALTNASIPAPYLLPAPDLAAAVTAPKLMCHVHVSGDVTLASSSNRYAPSPAQLPPQQLPPNLTNIYTVYRIQSCLENLRHVTFAKSKVLRSVKTLSAL